MRKLIALVCFFVLIGAATQSQAAFVDPYEQGLLDPVSFFVVDDPNSSDPGQVVLTTSSFNLPTNYQLEYMYSGVSSWTLLQPATSFTTDIEGKELVFLRLNNSVAQDIDTSGYLTFQGIESNDLFTTLIVDWGQINLSISTAANDDNLAPVPLPGAVWLFGAGLVGLVGMRRKKK